MSRREQSIVNLEKAMDRCARNGLALRVMDGLPYVVPVELADRTTASEGFVMEDHSLLNTEMNCDGGGW